MNNQDYSEISIFKPLDYLKQLFAPRVEESEEIYL